LKKDRRTYQHVPTNDRAGHGSGMFYMGRPHNRALSRRQRCAPHPDFEGAEGDAPPITTFGTGAWKACPGLRSELIFEVDEISWTQSRRATPRAAHLQPRPVYCCFGSYADICADHSPVVLIQGLAQRVWHTPKISSYTPRTRHSARLRSAAQPSSSTICRRTCTPWAGAVWNTVRLLAQWVWRNRRFVKHVRAEWSWSLDAPVAFSAAAWAPYSAGTGGLDKKEKGCGRECECEARAVWANCAVIWWCVTLSMNPQQF